MEQTQEKTSEADQKEKIVSRGMKELGKIKHGKNVYLSQNQQEAQESP